MRRKPLAGKGIVVTRPAHQAHELARLIKTAGGRPIVFPVIEIRDVEDLGPFMRLVDRLDEFDLAVFISPNSAERAMKLIGARRRFPHRLQVAAVGGGSLRELERHGVTGVVAPEGRYDSEALLELPALASVDGKRVVIFRGAGGRELLGEALRARGATVEYGECYRRVRPDLDVEPLLRAWADDKIDAIAVTSSEGLHNLFEILGAPGREFLLRTPFFVSHPRIAEAARGLQVRKVIVTGPGDQGILTGLEAYFSAPREQ